MKNGKKMLAALLAGIAMIALSACGNSNVAINEKNFPDKTFRSYVSEEFDITGDGYLDKDELSRVTDIDVVAKDTQLINWDESRVSSRRNFGNWIFIELE